LAAPGVRDLVTASCGLAAVCTIWGCVVFRQGRPASPPGAAEDFGATTC